MSNVKVAFICVHNSCRSQMAEAFAKVMGLEVFEAFSAGTEKRDQIDRIREILHLCGKPGDRACAPTHLERNNSHYDRKQGMFEP